MGVCICFLSNISYVNRFIGKLFNRVACRTDPLFYEVRHCFILYKSLMLIGVMSTNIQFLNIKLKFLIMKLKQLTLVAKSNGLKYNKIFVFLQTIINIEALQNFLEEKM